MGGSEHPSPPDLPATFGHANARFPNLGLTAPIITFCLTPWITSLFANISCEWRLSLTYFLPQSIITIIKMVFKGTTIKCYCPSNIQWKSWFNNLWFDRRSINQLNGFKRRKIMFQLEPIKKLNVMCWFDICYHKLFFVRNKKKVRS